MKKFTLALFFLLVLPLLLAANPCFEELEDAAFTTILSYASIPKIPLCGVSYSGGDDESAIPGRITYCNSDLSTYLEALTDGPGCSSIWEKAVYSVIERGATMKRIREKLRDEGYRKGDVVINGTVDLEEESALKKMELVLANDFSSVDVDCRTDLLLLKNGERYVIKGNFNVRGDRDRVLSVTSSDITVNGIYYKVSVKYRLTKVKEL